MEWGVSESVEEDGYQRGAVAARASIVANIRRDAETIKNQPTPNGIVDVWRFREVAEQLENFAERIERGEY